MTEEKSAAEKALQTNYKARSIKAQGGGREAAASDGTLGTEWVSTSPAGHARQANSFSLE